MNATETRIAIVGGGKACHDFLRMIHEAPRRFGLAGGGGADPDSDSAGLRFAREIGVGTISSDYHDLLNRDDVDLLVELTGDREVSSEIIAALPPHIHFVDHYASRFFWDLFDMIEHTSLLRRKGAERLRAERNRLKNILDSLPFEILVISTDYKVQLANRTFLDNNLLEYGDVLGHYCYDVEMLTRGPCDVSIDGCPHNSSLKGGRAVSTIVNMVDDDGEEHFASVRAAPIRNDQGEVLGVVESILDITDRMRTESHLKETRERLDQFIDTAPLLIYMTDAARRIRVANRFSLDTLGLDERAVVGHTMRSLLPEPAASEIQAAELRVLQTGQSAVHKGVMKLGGKDLHYRATLFPVRDDDEVVGLFNMIEDTTELIESERKLARRSEELSEARQLLRGVLDHSRDLIFLADAKGLVISFNKGAERALGYESDEVIGTPIVDLCRRPGEFRDLLEQTLFEGHAELYETPFVRRDGQDVLCNVSLTTIHEQDSADTEIIGICRDITTRRRLQDGLVRSDRLAALGKMAAGVAHEINNPLAVMESIAGIVEDTLDEEGAQLSVANQELLAKAADRLKSQVKRCSNITHGLLGFARKPQSASARVDVWALLDECLDLLQPELKGADVTIVRKYTAELPLIETAPSLLQQVLVNLLKNACDAIEETGRGQGEISLSLSMIAGAMNITVADDGVGIEAKALDKIFDLFQTSKPVGKGTGLGLAIVHDLVERLGGEIQVRSEYGQWTRFTLTLPETAPAGD